MENTEQRIKIAVQKSGRLTDHSIDLLERCGLKVTKSKDQLICYGENMPIDLLLVRDDDIPGLVSDDVCDLGIVGLNVVEEKRLKLEQEGSKGLFKQYSNLNSDIVGSRLPPRIMLNTPVRSLWKTPKLQRVTLDS